MQIDQDTIAEFLKVGGQYFVPAAALLRALYEGVRGRFPEGFANIALASLLTGATAISDGQTADLRSIGVEILGNATFMAGLLSFIFMYLLRQPYRGQMIDAAVGGVLGFIAWLLWTQLLKNDWPIWTAPLVVIAGGAAFIGLRIALRQIYRAMRIATNLLTIGLVLVVGGGVILLVQAIL